MPVITTYTAPAILTIENARTIDGEVVGNDLILTRGDLTTSNVGIVRGPAGDMGPRGIGALGTMGYAERTSNDPTTVFGASHDIFGLTVTFTAEAGRLYRITCQCAVQGDQPGDIGQIHITDSANTVLALAQARLLAPNHSRYVYFSRLIVPGAGSKTYKARAIRGVGVGGMIVGATTQAPMFIHVEDIGIG